MFHEYRDLITELKGKNARFDSLFEKHDELDHKIADAQAGSVRIGGVDVRQIGSLLAQYKSEKSGQ